MPRDNSITVHMSHRVHRSGSFVSVRARKREDDEDGRTSRVKEEDTCVRAMAVEEEEEEEEKGRRKAGGGGEEEREKIGGGKDGLSLCRCTRVRRNRATFALREKRRVYQRCHKERRRRKERDSKMS